MTFELALIAFIVVCTVASVAMALQEYFEERAKEKAAMKLFRESDMVKRAERLKKELIEHNRQQLALEYLNEKGEDEK